MSYNDLQLAAHARDLREELGLDQVSPIGNIEDLVGKMGHTLEVRSLRDDFSATCMTQNGIDFVIVLNEDHMWNERFKRFTIAHEIGHISLIEHHAEMIRNGGMLKSKTEFQSNNRVENEADKFASFFLAPTPFVRSLISNLEFNNESLIGLSNKINISLLATAFRFVNLTDLCCSLIVVDSLTERIKYEIRSKSMWDANRHELIGGELVKQGGSVSKFNRRVNNNLIEEDAVDISEYYQDNRTGLRCNESVFRLGYNNSIVVMLSSLDDPEI